jgi:hypothetical protein
MKVRRNASRPDTSAWPEFDLGTLTAAQRVEERIICDFERINSDPLSGLLAKRGEAFRSF